MDSPILYVLNFVCGGICIAAWLTPIAIFSYKAMKKQREKSALLLKNWATKSVYTLLRQEARSFGPFFGKSSNQHVYYIIVEDREGQRRRGWALCGGWFTGLMSEQVKVKWDQTGPETMPLPPQTPTPPQNNPLWDNDLDSSP
jgi:hypothetical protein